jgi:spore germination protein KB
MNTEVITTKQGILLIYMFIIGSAIVLSPGAEAKQDVWLAVLLALALAVPMISIYARILIIFPNKDLFDILHQLFGKVFGKIIAVLYVWYAFHLGALVIRNFSEFITVVSIPETPQLILVIFLGITCILMAKNGIEVLGRWTALVAPLITLVLLGIILLSISIFDYHKIKPFLYNGLSPVFKSSFSQFSFPYAETVVFAMIFKSVKNKFNPYKVYYIGILMGGMLLLLASVRNVLIIGGDTISSIYFPSYYAVSLINIGNFLQRIEVIISTTFLFSGIVKISICLMAASNGVAKILNIDNYRSVAIPVALLMMNLSCIVYKNSMEMFEWAVQIYKYYAIPFQIVIPVFIWIVAEIWSKRQKAVTIKHNC